MSDIHSELAEGLEPKFISLTLFYIMSYRLALSEYQDEKVNCIITNLYHWLEESKSVLSVQAFFLSSKVSEQISKSRIRRIVDNPREITLYNFIPCVQYCTE